MHTTPPPLPQCDVYRHLRLPSLLVGDPKLGGISTTLTAYTTLVAGGYDVDAMVFFGSSGSGGAAG